MKTYLIIALWGVSLVSFGQLNQVLYRIHSRHIDSTTFVRRFKHEEVVKALGALSKEFRVRRVGTSVEGRSINLVSYGTGRIQVLMWSQMHGDETTATRAILDVFRYLQAKDTPAEFKRKIQAGITWHFIPMLNPDGASRFTRRNHDGIDINRDAVRLQTPEGRTLKRVRDSLKADWGFNLHDQSRGTMVNGKPATISLLAPPFDPDRSVNDTRGDAMQLTRYMHDQVIGFIPGQIGIYPDDFEPRAFGDNIQKWGTRTILIESGGFGQDFEKQEIRRLNFVLLLSAVDAIVGGQFEKTPVPAYNEIPHNADGRLLECIVKNVNYQGLVRDIGLDRREIDSDDFRKYHARGFVSDLGDLRTSAAYVTYDMAGYEVTPGKSYDTVLESMGQFSQLPIESLISKGFTEYVVKGPIDRFTKPVKVNVVSAAVTGQEVQIGSNPSLLFWKNGLLEYVLVNGVVHKVN